MRVSPFFEFARCCSGHVERSWRVGPAPKCRRSAFWEGPKKSLQSVLCCTLQTCFGRNRDPKGARNAKQKTECRRAPESPEAVTEHKTGYKTADTLQSKVLVCTRPAEVQRNGGAIRAEISSARTACIFRISMSCCARNYFSAVRSRRRTSLSQLRKMPMKTGLSDTAEPSSSRENFDP